MPAKIDLVDIGGGNTGSVKRCLEMLELEFKNSTIENPPGGEIPVLLPGVGAFGPVMQHLKESGFDKRIKDLTKSGTPYLGICVGMQILFESSEEALNMPGLGLIPGRVLKYKEGKVPQIGWNLIELEKNGSRSDSKEASYPESGYVYFVNSYYPEPSRSKDILYSADYYVKFCAAVKCNNITAFQFHPEKSGSFGKSLITRWLAGVS